MPGFSSLLTSSEIDSIIRYVQGLGSSDLTTTTTIPPGDESGADIYGRLCAACHGAGGSGGSGGPIADTTFRGDDLAAVITVGLGTMPGFGSQLNDAQLTRLVAYVEGLGGAATATGTDGAATGTTFGTFHSGGGGSDGSAPPGDGSGDGAPAGAGVVLDAAPAPIGNPIGWSLALAIAAFLIALGSAITGALPKGADDPVAG